ncbi:MAG: dicarboxylate/amino acid:cation symporter [Bacilli bacterium]|nr:dicarboxylate/amino acid:cation symporter [Bacilli bacterium]MDD4298445.1 dicarboxylate/amino acid:cation symporter [Bacilli bacterium]MDD4643642.1 dicarboxylate/amino acid:cation symporter [Bacilli bacterium]
MLFKNNSLFKSYRFPLILLASIIIGSIIGVILKEDAVVLKPFGDIFLNLLFTIVVPLVFVTISSSVANMIDMKRLGKILYYMLLVFIITGVIASVIMLIVVTLIDPVGKSNIVLEIGEQVAGLNVGEQIVKALTVTDFSMILSKSHMLPLVIFAILIGICVSTLGKQATGIAKGLNSLSKVLMQGVKIIMYYAPIGLCAYFAALIGEFGPQLIGSYARSMAIYYPVCIIYFFAIFAFYAYLAGGKLGVKTFFKHMFKPSMTAIATQSSVATLPAELEAAEKIGIPKDIREVVLPIGATMHMDGSCLSAVLKIVFLFGVFNKPFTGVDTFLTAILISVLSGVVMSGIPGGGLIGEMLIVNLYNFPLAAFPIISTIAFLVDPPATWLNSTGDSVAAMLVARLTEGKNWLINKITPTQT